MHTTTERARGFAKRFKQTTMMLVLGIVAYASPAAALQGTGVMFLWNDWADATLNQDYIPNSNYRSDGVNDLRTGLRRTGTGLYTVYFGLPHDPLDWPVLSQVVAYGSDNTRCKFRKASQPILCKSGMNGQDGVCTQLFVACFNPAGGAVNSRFAVQLIGFPFNGRIDQAPGGFFETANTGTSVQFSWMQWGSGFIRRNDVPAAGNAVGVLPNLNRRGTGQYRFDFQNLGAQAPTGLVQVTAIGGDNVFCKPAGPPSVPSGTTTLRVDVNCYAGNTLADSDFTLNYDSLVTRRGWGYQGARAYAHLPTSSGYTPQRSFNTGGFSETTGINRVFRWGQGLYYVEHTTLSPLRSSAYVTASGSGSDYCKVEAWAGLNNGTGVYLRCFDYNGNAKDTTFQEFYQGGVIAPI